MEEEIDTTEEIFISGEEIEEIESTVQGEDLDEDLREEGDTLAD